MNDLLSKANIQKSLYHLGTFLLIFFSAEFGQYLFFAHETSPEIIWPPTGIALALVFLWGYPYAVPVFLGLLAAALTGPFEYMLPFALTMPLGQTAGIVAGVYLLKRLSCDGGFSVMKNVLRFLLVILLASTIAPAVTTLVSFFSGDLTAASMTWSRAWAGHVLSSLILTPFILIWWRGERHRISNGLIESVAVGLLLLVSIYLLFWTHPAFHYVFLFFTVFFVANFWISFRFSSRIVALSMLVTTVVGIAGFFFASNPGEDLGTQLFATELFLFLVVPIFYIFSALVKERAQSLAELERAVARIERESTVKNNFISVLAHELRNPLAPVKSTLEILEMQSQDTDTLRLIREALLQVHAMRRLLDDLLDMSRVTQGKFQLRITRAHLCGMIERCIATTRSLYNKEHVIKITPLCDDTLWIQVDPVRFEQSLVNILNNAAKYTDPGGVIEVVYKTTNDAFELSVKDNGIGIAPEHIEEIFEPFTQIREVSATSAGGIGIGLSLTKHIIELHGGTVEAKSAGPGKGSEFIIRLPFPKQRTGERLPTLTWERNIDSWKILVVDDNQAAADSLAKLLRLKGHTVEVCYVGSVALEIVKRTNPGLILLDIGLADMSGYEVAEKLRAQGFKNKIIALSGYGQQEDKDAARKAGCDFHITKPLSMDRFEEYLSSVQR